MNALDKKILEEHNTPEHIVFGSMNSKYCVLVALAIYLEYVLEFTRANNSKFLFCVSEEIPGNVKKLVSHLFYKVTKSPEWAEFVANSGGGVFDHNIGTHSIRKLETTRARLMGKSQDDVDQRQWW